MPTGPLTLEHVFYPDFLVCKDKFFISGLFSAFSLSSLIGFMYNGGMNIKGIILGAVRSLLWFSLAFGLGWAALYAVRYAALTFYYDYGQHVLL